MWMQQMRCDRSYQVVGCSLCLIQWVNGYKYYMHLFCVCVLIV